MAGLAALALALTAGSAQGFTPGITIGDDYFSPHGFNAGVSSLGTLNAGWRWGMSGSTGEAHNVREDHKLFYSGEPTTSSDDFDINASAGTFHYYCELHGYPGGGMDGVLRVKPQVNPFGSPGPGKAQVIWAGGTTTGSRFDVKFRVDHHRWKVWKNDTSTTDGVFGRGDRPVNYVPSRHTYWVRVRSEKRNVSIHSHFSPATLLNP